MDDNASIVPALTIIGIILCTIAGMIYYTFKFIKNKINHIKNEYRTRCDGVEKKLLSLKGVKNNLFVKDGTYVTVQIRDNDRKLLDLSLNNRIEFFEKNFSRTYSHASRVEQFRKQFRYSEKLTLDSLFELAWKTICALEDRDYFTENNENLVSSQNFEWINKMTNKILVGLNYKSINGKNEQLVRSIEKEIQQLEEKRMMSTDDIQKQSFQVVIDTNKKRLETQMKIKNTISLFDNDLKRLQATFKLIIEGVDAEISACKLGKKRIMTKWNDLVLNINLSEIDRIYEEQRQEFSA